MFKNTFNLNGIDYKVVNGLVHTLSKGTLDPCYWGDSNVLDSFARDRKLNLYARPKGQHAYGHQTGQRAKTLKEQAQHAPAHEHAQVTASKPGLNVWDFVLIFSACVIGIATVIALYQWIIILPRY